MPVALDTNEGPPLRQPQNTLEHPPLGNFNPTFPLFPDVTSRLKELVHHGFTALPPRRKFRKINELLVELILDTPEPCFLLAAVIDYIDHVNQLHLLQEPYRLNLFEFWLTTYSELPEDTCQLIRAKIVGKYIPRTSYQGTFPVGMEQEYPGSHFVVSHISPDVDTTVASFLGWLDAFGASIGSKLHFWAVPGGVPENHLNNLFKELLGPSALSCLVRPQTTLTLTAMDLITQKGMQKLEGHVSTLEINRKRKEDAVIYVDAQGHYLGDFRFTDMEKVRPILNTFKSMLHWFENSFHIQLIQLFAQEEVTPDDIITFHQNIFEQKMSQSGPESELDLEQKMQYTDFLLEIFSLDQGIEATYGDLFEQLGTREIHQATELMDALHKLSENHIFTSQGSLKEHRPTLFRFVQKAIELLDQALHKARTFVEQLGVIMHIKQHVLEIKPHTVLLRSDVEEIRELIAPYSYVTVVVPGENGSYYPVGVVKKKDLAKDTLGTCSLRDFSNYDEVKMSSYLQVISVIDHHKIELKTRQAAQITTGDVQSCNTLVAQKNFSINDCFGLAGQSQEKILEQLHTLKPTTPRNIRLLEKLLQKQRTASSNSLYWVDPQREFLESLLCLHAILDDTDLLTKVSEQDVECITDLLNRLKTLQLTQQTEILSLDDLPQDRLFTQVATQRILKNPEMYSLYTRIFDYKKHEAEAQILLSSQGLSNQFFLDTKEQNGCARVGQTKMFSSNFDTFYQTRDALIKLFLKNSIEKNQNTPEIDLYIHMISTIPTAQEVYQREQSPQHTHQDEMWIWISGSQTSQVHLARFLAGFRTLKQVQNNPFTLSLTQNPEHFEEIFTRNFTMATTGPHEQESATPMACLKYPPGILNSRKSMITPFLPKVVS